MSTEKLAGFKTTIGFKKKMTSLPYKDKNEQCVCVKKENIIIAKRGGR